jgi:hypothetical protein
MRIAPYAAVIWLLPTLPAALNAQAPDSYARRQATFEQLRDHQVVRVAGPGIPRGQGRVLEHSATALVLGSKPQPLRVPATSIDTLWTRGGSAGVGAIVGAILGVGLGALAGTELGEENAGSAKNVLGFAGFGAIGGALIGTAIGAPIGRWHRRFP